MVKVILLVIVILLLFGYIIYCQQTTLSKQKKYMADLNRKLEELSISIKFINSSLRELEKDINNTNK